MAVYPWCKNCKCKGEKCLVKAHKAFWVWAVDLTLGGRGGDRPRERKWATEKIALARERELLTNFQNGQVFTKSVTSNKTISQAVDEYNKRHLLIKSRSPRNNIYRIAKVKAFFGSLLVRNFKLADWENYLADYKGKLAIGTLNRELNLMKSFFNWCVKAEYLLKSPLAGFKKLKGATVRVRWLTDKEIETLCTVARKTDINMLRYILIGLNTGFRKSNIEALEGKDIHNGWITARKTKSGEPYSVPVTEAIRPILEVLMKVKPIGKLLEGRDYGRRFREIVRKAGLYTGHGHEDTVTIHTLRHTFAAHYLNNGGDIYKLSKLMGHHSVDVTQEVYGHLAAEHMKEQATAMSIGQSVVNWATTVISEAKEKLLENGNSHREKGISERWELNPRPHPPQGCSDEEDIK